jgi:hypothetical protein
MGFANDRSAKSQMIVAAGAAAGLLISTYNYVSPIGFLSPLSGISGTWGALLVVASSAIILLTSLAILKWPASSFFRFLGIVGIPLGIAGTSFCAQLLDSTPLLVAMLISFSGWLFWMARRKTPAPA